MDDVNHASDAATKITDADIVLAERRARSATDDAYTAARVAYASKARADVLRAGDLFRYAAALYQQAADLWTKRGSKTFAEHCAAMAKRLSGSAFARASLAATFQHVDPDAG